MADRNGTCGDRFTAVREALARNLDSGRSWGADFQLGAAVYAAVTG